jgi:transcriptional regulator with XRE-family HTH domain
MLAATIAKPESLGTRARRVRLSLRLTQHELSDLSGVSRYAIYLFENSLPVTLDARRRIIKELWAIKVNRLKN